MGDIEITKTKNWVFKMLSQYKKPITLILLGLISFIILVIAFNSYGKDYVVEIINSLVNNQIETINNNLKTELKTRDDAIQDLQKRLSDSEKTYINLKKRVGNVEIKIEERKPPATSAELRDRLNKLNLKPVN